ncbi:MAG TPA: valine--tRNA ligase [Nitrospirales bacterium]|nr:valine--tRNA ligase [Nitrospirales bacterium]
MMPTLAKTYQPQDAEKKWYQIWETRGYFQANLDSSNPAFSIVIPPPNITGALHMGHALNSTIQDILVRWFRMRGFNVLWLPGTDHAGIATQNVVERQLAKEGTNRETLGRTAFVERVWEWKAQYGETILNQLRSLGVSCDWSRLRFTLDEGLSKAVREVFVRLYEDGLIYRGTRLIHWCPRCLTALADIEVEHEETKGSLYTIRYPIDGNGDLALVIATTRPETMLGDTAVGVHPEDTRHSHSIGQSVRLPLTSRTIPIVADPILVNREFGTGAVKITPGHDFNDYEAGLRNHLNEISILDKHARIDPTQLSDVEPDVLSTVQGKPVLEARKQVLGFLEERGFLISTEPHKHSIGKCYRCRTVVEPFLSPQWYVKIQPLAGPAIQAVEAGDIRFIPKAWENNYLGWMRDIKDWCISRQIWWGHQIPAWYCEECDSAHAAPIIQRNVPERCPTCNGSHISQDPDVLDTWFSSALWPFSTLGWPAEQQDNPAQIEEAKQTLQTFYPTTVLVTGFDILFFWIARMIMMGLRFQNAIPFRDVYVHALVRDAEGKKMSKSKGNIIDPLSVMSEYGTDALRFTLAAMASPGRDIKLAPERIEGYRNFANKLWNAARFALDNVPDGFERVESERVESQINRWITSRLHRCIGDVNTSLGAYRFDEAANRLYQFVWHEYCDWYIEFSKPDLKPGDGEAQAHRRETIQTMLDVLQHIVRLLHPFMPFLTEELWSKLQRQPGEAEHVMVTAYPSQDESIVDTDVETAISAVIDVISSIRVVRSTYGISPGKILPDVVIIPANVATEAIVLNHVARIQGIGRIDSLRIGTTLAKPQGKYGSQVTKVADVHILLDGLVDFTKEQTRMEKRLTALRADLERVKKKLGSATFTANAPAAVVQKEQAKQHELQAECDKFSLGLSQLQD